MFLYLSIVSSLYESSLESDRPTWPTSLGFLVSVISYCLRSPWSQLPKYKYLSSREIRISVIRPAEKRMKKKTSLQVFELGVTLLKKKKEDEPRCSTEWLFGSDERGYDIAVFKSILCLSQYWLPLYLYKKNSCRFMTKISNHFHHAGSTNHYIFF